MNQLITIPLGIIIISVITFCCCCGVKNDFSEGSNSFSKRHRHELEETIRQYEIKTNADALNFLKYIGKFYIEHGSYEYKRLGTNLINFTAHLYSRPFDQYTLKASLNRTNVNPSFGLATIVERYLPVTQARVNGFVEIQNDLKNLLIFYVLPLRP